MKTKNKTLLEDVLAMMFFIVPTFIALSCYLIYDITTPKYTHKIEITRCSDYKVSVIEYKTNYEVPPIKSVYNGTDGYTIYLNLYLMAWDEIALNACGARIIGTKKIK